MPRTELPDIDLAVVVGTLTSDPVATTLASGSVLHRYEVTVRDPSRPDEPAQSVPVTWFDPVQPPAVVAGDRVAVVGRVRRRFFRAGGATRSSTEVVADRVLRAERGAARIRSTLEAATGAVGPSAGAAAAPAGM